MTTSPESACAVGDSLLTDYLRRLVADADHREPYAYSVDEITLLRPWPPGALEFFTGLGIVRELAPSSLVYLWECYEPHDAEPRWSTDASQGGKLVGTVYCRYGCGIHDVDPDRRREWGPSIEGIVCAVAKAVGCEAAPIVDVPERVWLLGSVSRRGENRDVFLARGAARRDSAAVLAAARRLAASPAPVVLCFGRSPTVDARPAVWRTVLSPPDVPPQGQRTGHRPPQRQGSLSWPLGHDDSPPRV